MSDGPIISYAQNGDDQIFMSGNSLWQVTWSDAAVKPGLGRPLTRWERLRWRLKAPFWRLRYAVEDLAEVTPYRVKGAWMVLTGRANWD